MKNLTEFEGGVSLEQRLESLTFIPRVYWFYGLSASGKSSLSHGLESILFQLGIPCVVLDGDKFRQGLNSDLGFSIKDRTENLRRAAEVSKLMAQNGMIVLSSFITPLKEQREMLSKILGSDLYRSVFVDCPLEICEVRDPKGLYEKARKGELENFTGVSAPFEPGEDDFLMIRAGQGIEENLHILKTRVFDDMELYLA